MSSGHRRDTNETIISNLVRAHFNKFSSVVVEKQQSYDSRISKLLDHASKSDTGVQGGKARFRLYQRVYSIGFLFLEFSFIVNHRRRTGLLIS